MQEIWKDVKGYESIYQVSNLGRVRSLDRKDNLGRVRKGRILKEKHNNRGYCIYCLKGVGKAKYILAHRLVAMHFIENKNNYPQVNHIDQNNKNNRVDNLEWCTNRYNAHFGDRIKRCGIKHRKRVTAIKEGKETTFESITIAEDELGLCRSSISNAIKRNGTAKGYKFKY